MIEKKFQEIINKIFCKNIPEKIAVAVSGGVDSMSLLFLLKELSHKKKIKIFALIVDHKVRLNSTNEALKVSNILQENNIDHSILTSYLEEPPCSNIESQLREVRYNLLYEFCIKNNINHLFIGHHEQDLAENFLIRLFRGSGIDGLSAMDFITNFREIKIIRPLLNFKKEELKNYLKKIKIDFAEDESNKDEIYLRNKIRNFIESLPDKKLLNQRIAMASKSILENKKLITKFLLEKAQNILKLEDLGYYKFNYANFINLTKEEAYRYLSWSLIDISGNPYKPRLNDLENLYFWLIEDNNKQKKRSLYGCIIAKITKLEFIIYREKSRISPIKIEKNNIWDNRFEINFSKKITKATIENIDAANFNKLEIKHNLKGVAKEIISTIPVIKKDGKIVAIPHLEYYQNFDISNKIDIKFKQHSPLSEL